jgi:hypothetical protein
LQIYLSYICIFHHISKYFNIVEYEDNVDQDQASSLINGHESDEESKCRPQEDIDNETIHKHVTFNILSPIPVTNGNDETEPINSIKDSDNTPVDKNIIDDFYDDMESKRRYNILNTIRVGFCALLAIQSMTKKFLFFRQLGS